MDQHAMAALKAFLSHNPNESPLDASAPDPLKTRGRPDRPDLARRLAPAHGDAPMGLDLLPLILAQLPLEKSYRVT